jgi:hypothetical protein
MVESKHRNTKTGRGSDMDDALFEALETRIPDKDTGPDPDDILTDLSGDDGEKNRQNATNIERLKRLLIDLDKTDLEYAELIVQMVRTRTGEHIELAQAVRIALFSCPQDEETIGRAYMKVCARTLKNK